MATKRGSMTWDTLLGSAEVPAPMKPAPAPPGTFPLGPGVQNTTPTPPPAQQGNRKLRTTHIRLGVEADAYLDRLDAAWRAAGYRGHISAAAVIRHALARLDQDAKDDAVVRAAKGSS